MSSEIKTIHALVLDASSNDAEQTLNILRNTGVAVRATLVVNSDELGDALGRQSWDIFLARDNCPQLPIRQALQLIAKSGRDIPVIQIGENLDSEKITAALNDGVQAFITEDAPELLKLTVTKEISHLEDRRRRKQAEAQLAEAEKRCELLLANSRDAIAYIHDGMHVYANQSYLELFGYDSFDDLECMPIMDMISVDYHTPFKDYLRQQSTTPTNKPFEFVGVQLNEAVFDGHLSLSSASFDGEPCTQVLINVQTDDAELQARLEQLSSADALTGLSNREHLHSKLADIINAAANNQLMGGLCYFELDQYTQWEEQFGLKAMDEVRQNFANWLTEKSQEHDFLARVGDNTFVLLRHDAQPDTFKAAIDTLVKSFAEHMLEIGKQTVTGTLSAGIYTITERAPDSNQVLNDAHSACARAQSRGGNSFRVFEASVDSKSNSHQQRDALRRIQEAMESGRIHLMFQPIVKLHGKEQQFFHVLLRVRDENDAPVQLQKLFPVTEGTDLALKLDYWVIAQAMRTLKEHRNSTGNDTRFFVQLSATALEDDGLAKYITRTRKASRLPDDAIIYQFDETAASTRLKRVIQLTETLAKAGIPMAVNQFGSGLASENILKHLPADRVQYVKIANEVINEDLARDGGMDKLSSLVNMAKVDERQTIVPMIEEAQTLAQIWPLGIDYVQGFYLSPPSASLYFDFSEACL